MSDIPGIPNPPSDEIPDPLMSNASANEASEPLVQPPPSPGPVAEQPTMVSALPEVSAPEPAYVPPASAQPAAPPPPPAKKKTNTGLIIAIVVLVVLCCCCLVAAAVAYQFGDLILNSTGLYY